GGHRPILEHCQPEPSDLIPRAHHAGRVGEQPGEKRTGARDGSPVNVHTLVTAPRTSRSPNRRAHYEPAGGSWTWDAKRRNRPDRQPGPTAEPNATVARHARAVTGLGNRIAAAIVRCGYGRRPSGNQPASD